MPKRKKMKKKTIKKTLWNRNNTIKIFNSAYLENHTAEKYRCNSQATIIRRSDSNVHDDGKKRMKEVMKRTE